MRSPPAKRSLKQQSQVVSTICVIVTACILDASIILLLMRADSSDVDYDQSFITVRRASTESPTASPTASPTVDACNARLTECMEQCESDYSLGGDAERPCSIGWSSFDNMGEENATECESLRDEVILACNDCSTLQSDCSHNCYRTETACYPPYDTESVSEDCKRYSSYAKTACGENWTASPTATVTVPPSTSHPTTTRTPTSTPTVECANCIRSTSEYKACRNDTDACVELILNHRDLTGSVPPELGELHNLRRFDVFDNDLTGTLPTEMGTLVSLTDINAGHNSLTGTLPSELAAMTDLVHLQVDMNGITGAIPGDILRRLTSLKTFRVSYNELRGSLPSDLTEDALYNLTALFADNNNFTGTIPTELTRLSQIEEILLSDNHLRGSLPTELGRTTSLKHLSAMRNSFTGTLPEEYADLVELLRVQLDSNSLDGTLPEAYHRLARLTRLSLGQNRLAGTIPQTYGQLPSITHFDIADNNVSGDVEFILNCSELVELTLENNVALCGNLSAKSDELVVYADNTGIGEDC
ncbi:hypothetical protein CYMTET_11466 [Cymbomonas tetramitiformis]|uniref:L domain-like protein n=1 Tax=Cymbomonas tetramitiformis TaxID=36881 RepID=A0AAE0LD53_9CHLO|nr:hypothetical protein CYMTET_11466 [Cymbomonas tetramitiformis]